MPLFPQLGPVFIDEKHRQILQRMEACYAESITINQSFWSEADQDTRYFSGDQSPFDSAMGNLPSSRKKQFNFNQIRTLVNMIQGHQRQNRKSIIATPVENGDQETSDQLTKVLMWICQQEGVLETISDAFQGALVTGMNLLKVWIDYRNDPISGNIRVDNSAYNTFLIDPYFRKTDLSDCNYIWKRSYLSKRACISMYPDKLDDIEPLFGSMSGNSRDGKFQFEPESYNFGVNNLLAVDEFEYRDFRTQKLLADSETGETMEWRNQDPEKLERFLKQYPQVTMIESEIPTVNLCCVIQGKVVYDGPQPLGVDSYSYIPVFAYYSPEMPYFPQRIQGVVRGLRDSQFLYNRVKVIQLDILESQINSGWIYKENALVNPMDVYQQGQGKGMALKEEAQMTDIQKIESARIDASIFTLTENLLSEFPKISGVSEELMGAASDDIAGVLSMLRQGAGLTTLQILFDQLDHSQKLLGKLMIDLIQANFTPGKIKKILEDEEPTPQFYNKAFGKYNAVVSDGLNTSTQRQIQMAQMLQLRQAGVAITDEDLIEAADFQGKKKIIENHQKQKQEIMQQQQQQQQSQMQEQQARTELAQARAEADRGLGIERASRVEENHALAVERRAAAIKDQDMGMLNLVRALKELETVDISHIKEYIAISEMLKQRADIDEAKSANNAGQAVAAVSKPPAQAPQEVPQPNPNLGEIP